VYEKRDEEKVKAWRVEQQQKLAQVMAEPDAVILCEDEMVLSTQTTFQKVWLKQGEYPKIDVSNTKKNQSIYGFLNLKTGQEHAFVKDHQTMAITVDCLKQLRVLYPSQKLVLYWDGAGWHRGSAVQQFIAADKKIEVVYFPPYSPEENPQEHVWKTSRAHVTHNQFISNIEKTAEAFSGYLNANKFQYRLLDFSARL
jgi:transposase